MLDPVGRVGIRIGLLFDDEPMVTEAFGLEPYPPAQMQPGPDLADDGVDQLELVRVAEPAHEGGFHFACSIPLE